MKKKIVPVIIAIVLIIIIAVLGLGSQIMKKYSYSKERADPNAYFMLQDENDAAIILQDEIIEECARLIEGTYYFDLGTVHKYFNKRFYEDRNENLLLYTVPDDIIRTNIGTDVVNSKNGDESFDFILSRYEDDVLYIAVDYVKEFTNLSYVIFDGPRRMQVYDQWEARQAAEVKKDTAVRLKGGIKSEILTDITAGDKVIILDKMETWCKVKTRDAFIGYVENSKLGEAAEEQPIPVTDYEEPVYTSQTRDHLICLGWHSIAGIPGNDTIYSVTEKTSGLNVIAPTWFILNDNMGNFESYASKQYVDIAHEKGLEVWGLVENIRNKNELDMYSILSSTSNRRNLIDNLIAEALNYGLEGINVDFEEISVEAGEHFIQFIRELSILCREHGLVLSVDNYVPYGFNGHYNREEQGIVADYVIIMGYDEHYVGGNTAGSVASIDYVESGISRTIEQVPVNKVINGVPFYTRIWETTGAAITSQAVGMQIADEWVSNHGLERVWDEETCQNYCEYTSGDTKYQVWLEDDESLRVKFNVMKNYQIGGVAFWRLGFDKESVWDVVEEYLD